MSEDAIRSLLETLDADESVRDRMGEDPAAVLGEYDLSPAERVAFLNGDEDSLRRLAGGDVATFGLYAQRAPSYQVEWRWWNDPKFRDFTKQSATNQGPHFPHCPHSPC